MADGQGGGIPSILIWIGVLLGVNLLSYVFDWGFIIY